MAGRAHGAVDACAAARREAERLELRVEEVWLRLDEAEVLESDAAVAALRVAADVADAIGSRTQADVARQRLRALGVRTWKRRGDVGTPLTERELLITLFLAVGALATANAAAAHPHEAEPAHGGTGQMIANGQNHGPFVNGVTCGGDPAAYGLESAHHGPDAGTPGKADGCYQTTGGVPPAQDDENPALG